MEFDPVGSARFIPSMIQNDTLIEVLDQDQLSECLKHIILNVDDSLYILDRVQSKYTVPDRFKAIRHIFTDFGEGNTFDSKKFIEFVKSFGKCLHIDILDSIATIFESTFSKNDQPSMKSRINITELKWQPKSSENFYKIYQICKRIAAENDRDAMSFAIREKFVGVTEKGYDRHCNIFNKAAEQNKKELVRLMIESGFDVNSGDFFSNKALIIASEKGHYDVVKLLLAAPGIDVNVKDVYHWTALSFASEKGHYEIVKLLLTVPGIDVNAKTNQDWTPLILASMHGHYEVVKLLLTVPGINVNARDKWHRTALISALIDGHHEVVKLLLAAPGINVNARDKYHKTALFYSNYETSKMLLDHGAIC